ncbi:MAG: glycine zipper 2TM domain-containing protein [Gammaproteobacteria bacterium]|nr:glycine zipper 2TM domain-containing protein [Gammaproteobacteria bacterium]
MKELIRKLTFTGAIIVGSIASATNALAGHDQDGTFYAYGKVVEAEPIIVKVIETAPHKECRQVRQQRVVRRDHHDDRILPSLFGGLLGGVIGHQFGGGRGKTALTIAGAFAGANIAKDSSHKHRHNRRFSVQERCTIVEQVHEVEKVDGYRVTYLYQGREFTRTTQRHPGTRIRLRVQVVPVPETLVSSSDGFLGGYPISTASYHPHESS